MSDEGHWKPGPPRSAEEKWWLLGQNLRAARKYLTQVSTEIQALDAKLMAITSMVDNALERFNNPEDDEND